MDDALLVRRAIGGDLDSFGQLYDAYFQRVYDFCWRVLRDPEQAAQATADVFTRALHDLPALAKAASVRSALFSSAHAAVLNRAPQAPIAAHEEAFGAFEVPDAARLADPSVAEGDAELPSLVWDAVSALNPRDYAVLDLHVRQQLDARELAPALGVGRSQASSLINRMKQAAGDIISSYVLARRGSDRCPRLREVLDTSGFPPYSDDVRRAVEDHVRDCPECSRTRASLPSPLAVFGALAPVPAPLALKGDIWREIAAAWDRPYDERAAAVAAGPVAGAGAAFGAAELTEPPAPLPEPEPARWGGDDLPPPPPRVGATGGGSDDMRNRVLLFMGAVVALLVVAFAGGALIAGGFGGGGGDGAGSDDTPTPRSTAATTTPGVRIDSPTPAPSPSVTETPAVTSTPTEVPVPPTSTAVPATPTPPPPEDTPTRTSVPTRTPRGGRTPTPPPPPPPPPPTATPNLPNVP